MSKFFDEFFDNSLGHKVRTPKFQKFEDFSDIVSSAHESDAKAVASSERRMRPDRQNT